VDRPLFKEDSHRPGAQSRPTLPAQQPASVPAQNQPVESGAEKSNFSRVVNTDDYDIPAFLRNRKR
jgi:hypothetical protein